MNRTYIKTPLVLGTICAVSAVLLALFNMITKPVIDDYEVKAKLAARQEVSCGYNVEAELDVDKPEGVIGICPLSDNGKLAGYVVELKDHGYGGDVNITASFAPDGKIMAVKLGTNSETPGVGKRYENSEKLGMFIGKGSSEPVPSSKKSLESADSALVSGATVTFLGISRALSTGSSFVKSQKGGF